ncbi:RDD family protein [Salinibacterium hongtaonis]|uniref:RDD family protein n=1 Tax=Homoserinimonas hongtaonis TaxID=2079791 RepID=UPI000D3A4DEB|nr:RDD family protein [Salinibacterium hongtaonis]AWB88661.1 hypothetical protein C2138_03045 [Salinibacterium hongtaonis]
MQSEQHAASVSAVAGAPVQSLQDDELITGEAVALDLRPADFVLRAAGALIDWGCYIVLFIAAMLVASSPLLASVVDEATITSISVVLLVLFIVVLPTVVETITQGRSLGKLAIGARIVRDDGGSIGFRHAFIRSLLGVVEIFMTFGGIATITALVHPRSKRLGDLIAGTYSQHERVAKADPPVYGVPLPLTEWARIADVAQLPPRLARRVTQFLRQAPGHSPDSRHRISQDLAREAAAFVSPVPDCDPELFLAAISAVRRDREYRKLRAERDRLARLEPVLTGLPHQFPDR